MAKLEIVSQGKNELAFLENIMRQIEDSRVFESCLQNRLKLGIIEVLGVDSQTMQNINATHRKKNQTTDVLSFPLIDSAKNAESAPLGSIVINIELAKDNAKIFHHSIESEIVLLFVHGLLHILGFDHECDNGEHRAMESTILQMLDIKLGLIDRSL